MKVEYYQERANGPWIQWTEGEVFHGDLSIAQRVCAGKIAQGEAPYAFVNHVKVYGLRFFTPDDVRPDSTYSRVVDWDCVKGWYVPLLQNKKQ